MAEVHYLKKSEHEAVLKCYKLDSNGGTIDISLADLATDNETFDANNAIVTIKEIFWGCKKDKQLDITRKDPDSANTHGHYYLTNSGSYDFVGFVDNAYEDWNIRLVGDGPYHAIIKLGKSGGYTAT